MYFRITYNNGYCGCDQEEIVKVADKDRAHELAGEGYNDYMSSWEDERFVDYPDRDDYEDEEDYYEDYDLAIENYYEGGGYTVEEVDEATAQEEGFTNYDD